MKHPSGPLTACIVCLAAAASTTTARAQEAAATAEAEYASGHYANALTLFEARAAAGDGTAAELAGQMLYYGGAVYGPAVDRDRQRAHRLLKQAANDGSAVARHLLERAAPEAGEAEKEYVPGPAGC